MLANGLVFAWLDAKTHSRAPTSHAKKNDLLGPEIQIHPEFGPEWLLNNYINDIIL